MQFVAETCDLEYANANTDDVLDNATMRAALRLLVTLIIQLVGSGCATIGHGEPVHHDEPLSIHQVEIPQKGKAAIDIDQEGTDVSILLRRQCVIEERRKVRRTTTRELLNASPSADLAIGGIGGVSVATGIGVVIDAQTNVHPNDDTSRTYNKLGPGGATVIGVGLLVAGSGLLIVPIVDAVRASGEEESTSTVELDGTVVDPAAPCAGHPLADTQVRGEVSRAYGPRNMGGPETNAEQFDLGRTDAEGRLEVDLTRLTFDEHRELPPTMTLYVGKTKAGEVELRPLFRRWEKKAWSSLDRIACRQPSTSTDCNGVEDFIRRFPNSKRVARARALLQEGQPKIAAIRDAEDWASSEQEQCAKAPTLDDPDAINLACSQVGTYLMLHANGKHAAEASKLKDAAEKRADELVARAEHKAEEARKKAEAEKRRKERAEEMATRRKCRGQCKIFCSRRWRSFRICYQGCVEAECN